MPSRPSRVCRKAGCNALTKDQSGFCEQHKIQAQTKAKQREKAVRDEYDKRRGTAAQRGYDSRWQKASKLFLSRPENALCADCLKQGITKPSQVVDHIKPHRGDYDLFWDESNWQGLCKRCHDRKTARERSGQPSKGCGPDGLPAGADHPWNV